MTKFKTCMMMLAVAGSISFTAVLPARAGDLYADGSLKDAPLAAAPVLWSGFYFGIHGGYGWGDSSSVSAPYESEDNVPPWGAFDCYGPIFYPQNNPYCGTGHTFDSDGWLAGVQLGHNWQIGGLVLGIEGDAGWLGIDGEAIHIRDEFDRDYTAVEYGWYGVLAARVGLALDRALIYVKGGGALAEIENTASDMDTPGCGCNGAYAIRKEDLTRSKDTHGGWALGGGIEYAFTDNWTAKAEYLYMDFGSESSTNAEGDSYEHDNELHTVKIGVNYVFRRDDGPLPLK